MRNWLNLPTLPSHNDVSESIMYFLMTYAHINGVDIANRTKTLRFIGNRFPAMLSYLRTLNDRGSDT